DKDTGKPVCRAMVWQDRRTLPICEELEATDGPDLVERTGMIIVPNDAATKIRWFLDHDETVRQGVAKNRLIYGTLEVIGRCSPCNGPLQ
ncbi:MAG: FGGY family carbohydrate kinase, partial [Eubacterium sp.]